MADLKVVNGDSSSPQGVEPSTSNGVASGPGDAAKKQRDDVLHSDVGSLESYQWQCHVLKQA